MIFKRSVIFNSTSNLAGGFISVKERSVAYFNNITVKSCSSKSGGFANVDFFSNIHINDSNIRECTARYGALLFMTTGYNSKAVIRNCDFYANEATDSFQISIENSNFTMSNVCFHNGTQIMLFSNSLVFLNNLTIINITCELMLDGCLGAFTDQTLATIDQIKIENLFSIDDGGIFYVYYSNLKCQNVSGKNIFTEYVGAILLSIKSNIIISNSMFEKFSNDGIQLLNSNFTIQNSVFNNFGLNSIMKGSVIFCQDYSSIFIVNCTFINIFSSENGSIIYIYGATHTVKYEIINSTFKNNSSLRSASIYHNKMAIGIITNSTFEFQTAKIGAVLFFDCSFSKTEPCILILLFNFFTNNYASYEGGVIKWNYISPQNLTSNNFTNNTAKIYGNDFANIPIRFGLNIYQNSSIVINYFQNQSYLKEGLVLNGSKSGHALPYEIEFFLLDSYNEIYKGSTDLSIKVDLLLNFTDNFENTFDFQDKTTAYVYGTTTVKIKNDTFLFDKISLVATPNSTFFLRFSTTSIPLFYSELIGITL